MKGENKMNFVLDASVTLAWCFADENTPESVALLNQLEIGSAFVPAIWSLEVGNILTMAGRKQRISLADITRFVALLDNINIQIDNETAYKGLHEILSLAHAEKLTTYDAAYLELAMRRGIPLASKDSQLCKVAERLGVKVLPV